MGISAGASPAAESATAAGVIDAEGNVVGPGCETGRSAMAPYGSKTGGSKLKNAFCAWPGFGSVHAQQIAMPIRIRN